MYEIGRVYIWQNQSGVLAHLNGTETTVVGPVETHLDLITGKRLQGQATDSTCPRDSNFYFAEAGDLRPKNPPAGERSVLDLFKLPELETA